MAEAAPPPEDSDLDPLADSPPGASAAAADPAAANVADLEPHAASAAAAAPVAWDEEPIRAAMPWDDAGDGVGPLGPEAPESAEVQEGAAPADGDGAAAGGGGSGSSRPSIVMHVDMAELLQVGVMTWTGHPVSRGCFTAH